MFCISVNCLIRSFYIVKFYKNSILALHSYTSGFWDIYLIVPRCPSRRMLIRREFRDHPIETRENCTSFPPPFLVILFDQCACTRAAEHIKGSRITRDIMSELIAAKIFRLLSLLHFHARPGLSTNTVESRGTWSCSKRIERNQICLMSICRAK